MLIIYAKQGPLFGMASNTSEEGTKTKICRDSTRGEGGGGMSSFSGIYEKYMSRAQLLRVQGQIGLLS